MLALKLRPKVVYTIACLKTENIMHISRFSQEHGLQRPSIEYYAFRSVGYEKFQALRVVDTLFQQFNALPGISEEISVVRHKTQFWLSELQAAYSGQPQHPATQDLKAILTHYDLHQKDWIDLITAVEMDIDKLYLADDDELNRYASKKRGSFLRLIATVLMGNDHPAQAITQLGCAIERIKLIQTENDGVQYKVKPDFTDAKKVRLERALCEIRKQGGKSLKSMAT